MGAFGLIATIVGIFCVTEKVADGEDPMKALYRGYFVTAILSIIFVYIATTWLFNNIWFFYCGLVGIGLSIVFLYVTLYYTDSKYRPGTDDRKRVENRSGDQHHLGICGGP